MFAGSLARRLHKIAHEQGEEGHAICLIAYRLLWKLLTRIPLARSDLFIITTDHYLELGLEEQGMISGEIIHGAHKK